MIEPEEYIVIDGDCNEHCFESENDAISFHDCNIEDGHYGMSLVHNDREWCYETQQWWDC